MKIDEGLLKYDEKSVYNLRTLYHSYGYSQYKMSKFEEYDLYVRNKDFLVSDSIITFTDTSTGKLLALKPDVTLSIINNFKYEAGQVQKLYYNENVYRTSKSTHTYKEIMQTGLECVGDIGLYDICEVIILAAKSLELIDNRYILQISHIGLLAAVLKDCCIKEEHQAEILSLINSKNNDGIALFCEKYGYGDNIGRILKVFTENFYSADEAFCALESIADGKNAQNELMEFRSILNILGSQGMTGKFTVDFSASTDMNYYDGVVFKGYINGIPTGICSGGQYNKLMKKMGRDGGAIGFAVYLDALERFNQSPKLFDVDTVLIESNDINATVCAAQKLLAEGVSVRVCRVIPNNIKFRRAIKVVDKGLVNICENA